MATVQLSDIIDVTVFQDIQPELTPELTRIFQSGMVLKSPFFDNLAAAPGRTAELPYWNDLDSSSEPNYSSDDATQATPDNVDQSKQVAKKVHLNNGWSSMDLARELAMGADAIQHIRNRVEAWWTRQWQKRIVNATLGIYNNNVANDSGDMVHDIAIEDGNNAATANLFSRSAFVDAAFTLGDHFDDIVAMQVHSTVYNTMVANDDITFVEPSQSSFITGERGRIPFFMDKLVIIDDGAPKVAGSTSGFKYITTLYGQNVFAYGEASPVVPVEIDRVPQAGHGGGEEQLWSRKTWMLHPLGHTNNNATTTANENQQNLADLTAAANWTRTYERKNVPVAFLVTNG